MKVTEKASAKVNLFLHVGERRSDGFHPLQSLAVFTDAGDMLHAEEAPNLSLAIDGPFGAGLAAESGNLVLRAAAALARQTGVPAGAALTLTKNLPVASGIGGGSADAAAGLRALKRLWNIEIRDTALLDVAAALGSDVPVCVPSVSAYMEGRGEILTQVAVPRLPMLLVNPGVAVPTRDVFARIQKRSGVGRALPHDGFADPISLLRFLADTCNDLEAPARALQPVIGKVLNELSVLPGVALARMSGSGATCFALFEDADACAHGAKTIQNAHANWWVTATATR
ncbi:MAG: 4-(cytidine 5'-diphospho)-2-C-methyl-D-erythritol kinase [Alphaproteobacteria bacterium]|nr:4-(cytidine 5'-diphospho)-2-C-methyl-D-erythritol kinase [Alphaproteobacteria bacterium]